MAMPVSGRQAGLFRPEVVKGYLIQPKESRLRDEFQVLFPAADAVFLAPWDA